MNKKLLSILIPTYNRSEYLDKALKSIFEQIKLKDDLKYQIEILVSDNNSSDNTQQILKKYMEKSKKYEILFTFWKNDNNLGPDGNFEKLIKKSTGNFCWLFGDDEFLIDKGLLIVYKILLENNNIGLLHIRNNNKKIEKFLKTDVQTYIENISYMISFITANIFNKNYLDKNLNIEKFKNKNLIQELFYFQAILKSPENIILSENIFKTERADNVGSYKLFETFAKNQNEIFDFFITFGLKRNTIRSINKKMLRCFFPIWIVDYKKNKDKNKWPNENIYNEMKKIYSNYKEFYLYCVPLIKMPNKFSKIYLYFIRIINKIFY
ncbi:MAG: glycosyltransferase family 2 protein [Cetobacterium sp.]